MPTNAILPFFHIKVFNTIGLTKNTKNQLSHIVDDTFVYPSSNFYRYRGHSPEKSRVKLNESISHALNVQFYEFFNDRAPKIRERDAALQISIVSDPLFDFMKISKLVFILNDLLTVRRNPGSIGY